MPLNELHSSDSGVVYKDNKNKEMNFSSSSSSSSSSDASEEEAQPVSSLELDAENSLLLPEENFLLKALKNAESRAFGIPQEFPFSKVYVKIDWLAAEDTALIKKLFTYFFQHQNIKPIAIEILFSSKITTFDPACITSEQLKNLLTRAFGGNSFLFIGYLSSLSENNLSIDIGKWSDLIFSLIIKKYNLVRDKEKDKGKEKIDKSLINHFACNIDYLHPLSIDKEKLEKLVLFLFLLAIESHQLVALQTWIKKPDYLKIIKEKNNQYYFLYELFKANKDHLKIFFELFKDEPTFFYDKNHNSLLHYSFGNNKSNLKLVFALRPQDINHQNDKGNTVLHLAALNGDLESARFLLVNGANPEIENNDNATFWTIEDLCEPTLLTRYRQYKQKGNALKSPPEVIEHDDLLCAYYAVAYGSGFFHQSAPSLFENSIFLPARKRNTNPKSSSSLHQCHKEFNFPSSCAVFSVKELKKLIEKTTCESAIFDMQQYKECKQEEQYEQFIKVIKNAIAQGFPVFIPFSLDIYYCNSRHALSFRVARLLFTLASQHEAWLL